MAEDRAQGFGERLKEARERRGLSLQKIAVTTKISARVLDALEHNDPSKLPGGLFTRAFVRAYAQEVGLDPEDTVRRFADAFPDDAEPPVVASEVVEFDTEPDRRALKTVLQLVGLSLIVAIVVLYFTWGARHRAASKGAASTGQAAESIAQSTEPDSSVHPSADMSTVQPSGGPPPAAFPAPGAAASAPAGSASGGSSAPAPAAGTSGAPASSPGANVPTGVSSGTAAAAPAPTGGLATGALKIVLAPTSPCWVSVTVDGARTVARIINGGERVELTGQREVVLTAGDAGSLGFTVNGQPARALGGRGQVVTARITPDNYKTFTGGL
jgi:cytoskeleton protein RodZ